MGVVHQPIQDRIGEGVVTDGGMPLIGGQLAQDGDCVFEVAVIEDFNEVLAFGGSQRFQAPALGNQSPNAKALLERT